MNSDSVFYVREFFPTVLANGPENSGLAHFVWNSTQSRFPEVSEWHTLHGNTHNPVFQWHTPIPFCVTIGVAHFSHSIHIGINTYSKTIREREHPLGERGGRVMAS